MNDEYKPRFSFEVTEEQKTRSDILMSTYGIRKAIFSIILDDLLDLIQERGQVVVGILLDRAVKPREIMPTLSEAERRVK